MKRKDARRQTHDDGPGRALPTIWSAHSDPDPDVLARMVMRQEAIKKATGR